MNSEDPKSGLAPVFSNEFPQVEPASKPNSFHRQENDDSGSGLSLSDLLYEESVTFLEVIEHEGEVTPLLEAMIMLNSGSLASKIDSYAFVLDRLRGEMDFRKKRAQKEKEIAEACERVTETIEKQLLFVMQKFKKSELAGNHEKFKVIQGPPTINLREDTPLDSIPQQFIRTKIEKSLDKKAVADAYREETRTLSEMPHMFGEFFVAKRSPFLRRLPNTKSSKEIQDDTQKE